ncbi:LuxR C-terminal-related transcriptional regulator [Derxia gummosa]|uniref:LuxR C-terminal-related transcriptional regulator n=1 Tax=Derxia gummosa DSM 723 TaxID=1121388 RepID=A0A8B6X5E8_9BURK|nr:LuxR C-terminal-related transcriptional regulator [Derxia gummosa]
MTSGSSRTADPSGGALVRARLRPPLATPRWLARPRLERSLSDWLVATAPLTGDVPGARVAVVAAPPGAGKTTLLAQWHAALGADGWHAGWLAIDAGNEPPATLLACVIDALGAARGPAAGAARMRRRDGFAPLPALLATLVDGLAATRRPIALFIDDADRLSDQAAVDLLDTLARLGPPGLLLVLAGRAEPALRLGAQALAGRLLRLPADALRLNLAEARALAALNGTGGSDAAAAAESAVADPIAALWRRTEGWVTGLVLGMLPHACLPQADVADNPALARYLADSVLARLPAPAVALLHDAAPFARFDAALCDALGPREDSRAILDELEHRHLFVKPLGDGWYRFHALFAEHLCTRLHRAEPGRERALRLRAAHWFAARGHWREAVAEALAIGDDALALPWAEAFSRRMVETGEVAVVADWLGGLPLRLRQHSLPLRLIQAWASAFSLDLRRARRALADLEADIAAGRLAADAATRGDCLAVGAIIDGLSDRSDAAIDGADAVLATSPEPGGWAERTAHIARTFGLCSAARFAEALACGRADAAECRAASDRPPPDATIAGRPSLSAAVASRPAPLYLDVFQHSMRGLSHITAGELDAARRVLSHALALAEAGAGPLSAAATLPAGYLAEVLHEQGEPAEAEALLRGREPAAFGVTALGSLARYCAVSARIAAGQGRLDAALAVLARGEQAAAERDWPRLLALCLAERIRLLCDAGRLDEARAAVTRACDALPATPPPRPSSRLETWLAWQEARATLDLHDGRPTDAATAFFGAAVQARAAGFHYRAARMQLLHAVALDAGGMPAEAMRALAALLPDIETQGLVASLADLCPRVELLAAARRLIEVPAVAGSPVRAAPGGGTALLSPRERAILAGLADGLTNKAIARVAGVTPETVKWHLKNIFVKLDVSNRQEAMRHALLLGLAAAPQPPRAGS